MSISDYLENKMLDHVFRYGTQPYTGASALYLALHDQNPTDSAASTEISGNSYSRKSISFSAASNGSIAAIATNGAVADFLDMPNCTVRYASIWDSASGATNMLWYGQLSADKVVASGDALRISGLTIYLD